MPPPTFKILFLHSHNLITSQSFSTLSPFCFNLSKLFSSLKTAHAHQHTPIASQLINISANFNRFKTSNTKDWNLVMKSALDFGLFELGIMFYRQMMQVGVEHDSFTLPIINQLYNKLGCDVGYGKMIHCVGIQIGFSSDVYFCNTLIGFYVGCGYISLAHKLFGEMPQRDVVSWTTMISGYVSEGNDMCAIELFGDMRRDLEPNPITFITMLQSCSSLRDVILGNQFHGYLLKKGSINDNSVSNTLLHMYTSLGTYKDVVILVSDIGTKDVVTWNIMISCNLAMGNFEAILESFHQMRKEVSPSVETLTFISSALVKYGNYSQGQQLHSFAIKTGLYDHIFLTCLMDLYARLDQCDSSFKLFSEIPCQTTTTLSILMCGFIEHGHYDKAIGLFKQLQFHELESMTDVIRCVLDISSHTGALRMGREVHGFYIRNMLFNSSESSSLLETALLNMYIRCGSVTSARHCFSTMVEKDVVAWTSMIEGLGTYGLGHEALAHFNQMLNHGIEPNAITFLSLLSACSHAGLTIEGCELLYALKWKFGIEPELNHYTCIVDLLGRSGKLKEALALILKIVVYPDSRIWGALLSASRIYMDKIVGEYAAKCLLELEPDNVGYHIVFSNMQARAEQWAEVEELRTTVMETNPTKDPGWSCIETNGEFQGFVSNDRSQLDVEKVYELLGCLTTQMKDCDFYCLLK